MKDKAAHACRALCRARVAEESQRRRGTRIAEHLKLVFSITDRRALSCPSAALWLMEIGKARFMPVSNGDRTDCVGIGDVQHGPTRQRMQGKSR